MPGQRGLRSGRCLSGGFGRTAIASSLHGQLARARTRGDAAHYPVYAPPVPRAGPARTRGCYPPRGTAKLLRNVVVQWLSCLTVMTAECMLGRCICGLYYHTLHACTAARCATPVRKQKCSARGTGTAPVRCLWPARAPIACAPHAPCLCTRPLTYIYIPPLLRYPVSQGTEQDELFHVFFDHAPAGQALLAFASAFAWAK